MIPVNTPKHINSVTIPEKIKSDPKYIELTTQKYFSQPRRLYQEYMKKIYIDKETQVLMSNPKKADLLQCLKKSLLNIVESDGNVSEQQEFAKFLLDGGFGDDEAVLLTVIETLPKLFLLDPYAQLGIVFAIKEGKFGTDNNKIKAMLALTEGIGLSTTANKKLTEVILNSGKATARHIALNYPALNRILYACDLMPKLITKSVLRLREKFRDEKDFLRQLIECICVNPTEGIQRQQKEFLNIFYAGNAELLRQIKDDKTQLQECFQTQIECLFLNGKLEEYPDILESCIKKLILLPNLADLNKHAMLTLILRKYNPETHNLIIDFLSNMELKEKSEQMLVAWGFFLGNFGTDLETLNNLAQKVLVKINNKQAQQRILKFIRYNSDRIPVAFFKTALYLLEKWGHIGLLRKRNLNIHSHEEIKNIFLGLWDVYGKQQIN